MFFTFDVVTGSLFLHHRHKDTRQGLTGKEVILFRKKNREGEALKEGGRAKKENF